MISSSNSAVKYIATKAKTHTSGVLDRNLVYLKLYPNSGSIDHRLESDKTLRVSQINQLIRTRDGLDQVDMLSSEEIQDMLIYVCTY